MKKTKWKKKWWKKKGGEKKCGEKKKVVKKKGVKKKRRWKNASQLEVKTSLSAAVKKSATNKKRREMKWKKNSPKISLQISPQISPLQINFFTTIFCHPSSQTFYAELPYCWGPIWSKGGTRRRASIEKNINFSMGGLHFFPPSVLGLLDFSLVPPPPLLLSSSALPLCTPPPFVGSNNCMCYLIFVSFNII